jgi:large subunit ribosomal protein L18
VFRSGSHIYAQLIDDDAGKTIAAASSVELKAKNAKTSQAEQVGTKIAEKGVAKGVTHVVFDRGGYKYHGRVKALAEAARKAGLQF